jgi:hypothetical protein
MQKVRISKKDGTSTPYFYAHEESADRTRQTVYKDTSSGVKRMKGVSYDAVAKRMRRR